MMVKSNNIQYDEKLLDNNLIADIICLHSKNNHEKYLLDLMHFSTEKSADEIYWVTKNRKIIYANECACNTLGYSKNEIINKKVEDLRPKLFENSVKDEWDKLFRDNENKTYITSHRKASGEVYPVESHSRYFKSDSLEFLCIYSRDISEKNEYENRLRRSEQEKTLILNSVHENIVYYDCNFKIIWANEEPAKSVNMRPEEIVGRTCYRLFYGRNSPCKDCTIMKAMQSGKSFAVEKKDRNGKNVKITAYPVFDDDGKVIGAVESVLDISKRKKAEKALELSKKQYKELFSTMKNGFVLHKIIQDENKKACNYRFLEINPAFEKMTGLYAKDIQGMTFTDLFPGRSPKSIERYGRVATTGIAEEFVDYNPEFDRHYNIYSYCPRPGYFAALFTDITDLINLKKTQKKSLQQIEKNFEQLAILNDEIRNPLQAITGYVMLEDFKYSYEVIEQANAINRLVNRLDQRWLESEKIRDFLRKHYQFD